MRDITLDYPFMTDKHLHLDYGFEEERWKMLEEIKQLRKEIEQLERRDEYRRRAFEDQMDYKKLWNRYVENVGISRR